MRRFGWIACVAICFCSWGSPASAAEPSPKPRLVILIFFDQLRGDYLARWESSFGPGGFRRLMKDGAWWTNCHYPYAYTVTGAGHASVATGFNPSEHGIVGNDWYERPSTSAVNCVSNARFERVPPKIVAPIEVPVTPNEEETPKLKLLGIAPERMMKPSIADIYKSNGGRVVSLSFKDRGAVLPGGRSPDACYWFDSNTGEFVTSAYYRDRLHSWMDAFNRSGKVDRWRDRSWDHLRPDLNYVHLVGGDDLDGEGKGVAQGRAFPHLFAPSAVKTKAGYYKALYNSPFANDLMLELAKESIKAERLGADDVPDLLSISFSCNDAIGHTWGPDSQEVLDVTLRSDAMMKELLDFLDAQVGVGKYDVVVTADHGVCPLPEQSKREGRDAGRISPAVMLKKAELHLSERFGAGKGSWIESKTGPGLYLQHETAKARGVELVAVQNELAKWLREQPGIEKVYTREQLESKVATDDKTLAAWRLSYYSDRCGDVFIVQKPYYLFSGEKETGTTHGTPHEYDTHVPLLIFGANVKAGQHAERVSPLSASAILAKLGGMTPTKGSAEAPTGWME